MWTAADADARLHVHLCLWGLNQLKENKKSNCKFEKMFFQLEKNRDVFKKRILNITLKYKRKKIKDCI